MPSGSIPHGQQRANAGKRHLNRAVYTADVQGYTPGERDEEAMIERADHLNVPCNIDAEYATIGAMYLDNQIIPEILEVIESPDDFKNHANRTIVRAMLEIYTRGDPVDYISVAEELQRIGQVEDAGGIANATSGRYADFCVVAWRGINYAKIVARHARKRELLDGMSRVVKEVWKSDVTADDALAAIATEFQPLSDKLAENSRIDNGIISADALMRLEIPEMRWPIAAIMPEGLTIIGAPPKTGKSAIALQLALSIASGANALGNAPTAKGDVLYLALEDSHARLKDRIGRQLCNEAPPLNLDLLLRTPEMLAGGLIQIESWLRRHPEASAVFIDTFGAFRGFGSQVDNANLFTADYHDMNTLQQLGLKHHVAIVALHHLRKDRSATDPLESLSGTTGISAPADAVWVLSRERNQELGELQIIGRDVMEQNMAVKLSGLTLTWEVIGDAQDVALKEGQRKVFEALRSLRMASTPSMIAAQTGESLNTVKTRVFRMKTDGLLVTVDPKKGTYWFAKQQSSGI